MGVLGALLALAGCDNQAIKELEEGMSTEADVVARFGQPENVWDAADGRVFEYNRHDDSLPPGTTQIVQYGNDLVGWTDITIPATSAGAVTITPGTPSDQVRVVIPDIGDKMFARLKVIE